jgi:tetratricopeptide (TPR) repeat protein
MRARRPIARLMAQDCAELIRSAGSKLLVLSCLLACYQPIPSTHGQAARDPLSEHYAAAQGSLRSGDQERAAVEYRAFLGEAIHRVANAKARTGDLGAAAQSFDEALAFTGPDAATRLDYAAVLFDDNRLKDAASQVQSVVDSEPRNVRARVLAGRIFFEEKNYPAAKAQFEAAVAIGGVNEIWRLLSITYLRLQELDKAHSLLEKTITTLGDTPANRVAVAMVYYYGDYPDQAVGELKKVIAGDNAAPEAHYDLGLAYLARNEEAGYPRAIPEFKLELKIDPDHFPSQYMLGYIALKQRDFDRAERELLRAADLRPQDIGTELLLGQLYSETHRGPKAEAVLRRVIAASDENAPDYLLIRAHYMLGRMFLESDRTEEGAREIRKSEALRKQVRLTSAEISGGGIQRPGAASSGKIDNISRPRQGRPAPENERAQAQAFINQISPAIAESYYNLAGIAAGHKDPATAGLYLKKAGEWDPSLVRPNQ